MICTFEGEATAVEVAGVGAVNLLRQGAFKEGLATRIELATASVGRTKSPVILLPGPGADFDPVRIGRPSDEFRAGYTNESGMLTVTIHKGVVKQGKYSGEVEGTEACNSCDVIWTQERAVKILVTLDIPRVARDPLRLTGALPFHTPPQPEERLETLSLADAKGMQKCDGATVEVDDAIAWSATGDGSLRMDGGLLVTSTGFRIKVTSSFEPRVGALPEISPAPVPQEGWWGSALALVGLVGALICLLLVWRRGRPDRDLAGVLVHAFPTVDRLMELAAASSLALGTSTPRSPKRLARKLVARGKRQGLLAQLVAVAYERARESAPLAAFYRKYFSLLEPATSTVLEALVDRDAGFGDFRSWLEKASALERQVCRVEIDQKPSGTGFLVGPNLVLTNQHVVRGVGPDQGGRVRVRFDMVAPGRAGVVHALAKDWLRDSSPPSNSDIDPRIRTAPTGEELDYALLCTESDVGEEVVDGRRRGWQTLTPNAPPATPRGMLVIVQHPNGEHLQFAFDPQAILEVREFRLRYRTNTLPGSSGSPCFDLRWGLLALHHSGHTDFKPAWNQGIPIGAIARLLAQRHRLPPGASEL